MASSTPPPPSSSQEQQAAAAATATTSDGPLTGRCLCGQITWAVRAGVAPVANVVCFCDNCQRQTGTHLLCTSVFPKEAFAITSAVAPQCYTDTQVASGNALQRFFCGTCGSSLYGTSLGAERRGYVSVGAGTVDRVHSSSSTGTGQLEVGPDGEQGRGRGQGRPAWEWTPNMVVWEEGRPAWLKGLAIVEKENPLPYPTTTGTTGTSSNE